MFSNEHVSDPLGIKSSLNPTSGMSMPIVRLPMFLNWTWMTVVGDRGGPTERQDPNARAEFKSITCDVANSYLPISLSVLDCDFQMKQ